MTEINAPALARQDLSTSCRTPASSEAGALTLPDLAARIESEHQAAHRAARTAIEHALECGQLLLEAKASVGHGGWLPWIEANLSFGERQARKRETSSRDGSRGMGKHLIDDGLFQRFVTIHTKPSDIGVDDDVPLDPATGRDYEDLLRKLAELEPTLDAENKYPPAYFEDEAIEVRRQFIPLIERLRADPTFPTIVRETAPKWSGLLARLALVFHLVELAELKRLDKTMLPYQRHRVTVPAVTRAATFLRKIVLPNLFRLGFDTMPEEGEPAAHARWIAGHILAHGLERVTAREIGRACRQLRGKPEEIEQSMEVLVHAGWADRAQARTDSLQWHVNPAVHQVFAAAAKSEKDRRERVVKLLRTRVGDL
jgi:Protein of unknown function (DUF3987)/Protein of unknown function (DUF3102)